MYKPVYFESYTWHIAHPEPNTGWPYSGMVQSSVHPLEDLDHVQKTVSTVLINLIIFIVWPLPPTFKFEKILFIAS